MNKIKKYIGIFVKNDKVRLIFSGIFICTLFFGYILKKGDCKAQLELIALYKDQKELYEDINDTETMKGYEKKLEKAKKEYNNDIFCKF